MTTPVLANAAKGFRYVLVSQAVVLALGLLKAFFIPMLLSVSNYGYWQIYVFYTVYVGLFGLGFNDGLYLRYGGHDLSSLPLKTIRPAIHIYVLLLFIGSLIFAWIYSHDVDPNRRVIMYLVAANIVVMGLLAIFSQTLQATNQLKSYSIFNSADKLFFLLLLPALFLFQTDSYLYLAAADLGSKLFVLVFIFLLHKELLIGSCVRFGIALKETFDNIKAGSQLMIANVSGMLVLGTGRFVIEYFDSLDNYAYYAFGVSMTNLALVAITALSVVTYPTLKRLPESNYLGYYDTTNRRLFTFNCMMLFVYFPAVFFIEWVLPKYTSVIPYLNVLFAITALQGKMQLLNNTYYKAMRRETAMLKANFSSLLIVAVLSAVGYAVTRSIESIAYAALVTMIYRVHASERYLRRQMGGSMNGIFWLELFALTVFLSSTSLLRLHLAVLVCAAMLAACLFVMRKELESLIRLASGGTR